MAFTLDLRKKKSLPEKMGPEQKPELKPEPKAELEALGPQAQLAQPLVWQASHPRPNKFKALLAGGVLFVSAAGFIYFARDYIFGLLLALGGVALIASAFYAPEHSVVRLDRASITINDQRYPFSIFKSFWINYDPPRDKELILVMQRLLAPVLRVPLAEADPLEIRKIMISLVAEKEYEDSLLDQLVRKLSQ